MGDITSLKNFLLTNDLDKFVRSLKEFDLNYLNKNEVEVDWRDLREIGEKFTIMQIAVIQNQKKFVDALLNFNVDPNYGTGRKKPVLLAARYGYCKILESFRDHKWNVNFDVCTEKREQQGTISGEENILHLGSMIDK